MVAALSCNWNASCSLRPIKLTRLKDSVTKPTNSIEFKRLPFNHPLFVLYSSGTTGAPKCLVHGAGGTLLQHLKEHQLHCDIKPRDRLFFFTTCGWMMWIWMVSSLATGASIVLYEGSPFYPKPSAMFDLVELTVTARPVTGHAPYSAVHRGVVEFDVAVDGVS